MDIHTEELILDRLSQIYRGLQAIASRLGLPLEHMQVETEKELEFEEELLEEIEGEDQDED